jgi:parvulin-like peptidyl-prolyl isomerase
MKGRTRAYRQVLSELVVRELLLQEAIARGIEADAQGLEQAYNEARVPYKDDAAWAEAIKGEGFTLETYRAELRAKRTVDALIVQEGRETVEPTEAELKEFYDKNPGLFGGDSVRVAQIQLRVANPWSEAAKAQVRTATEQIRRRALSGEDFARLAKEHSSDPRSAGRGGEIEAFTRDQMPAAFAAAAFGLKPGELSEVVETPLGFHVIKLLERIPRDAPPFEVVQDRLRPHVMQTRAQQRLEALTNRLRAKAKVERFL